MAKSTASRNQKIVNIAGSSISAVASILGKRRKTTFVSILSEQLIPEITVNGIKFWGFGGWSSYRASSLLTKEPETIKWIDSFEDNSVFWDIGANIGVYSLYAASKGHQVFSFEPSLMNVAILTKNIELNGMGKKIFPMPIAVIEDSYERSTLSMNATQPGNTGGQFHGGTNVFHQGIMGFSIEKIVSDLDVPRPDYIKVDVDGIEPQIIKGGKTVLQHQDVKSLSVELAKDSEEFRQANDMLNELGFHITSESSGERPIKNFIFSKKA